jgi:hypothetical protein
MAARPGIELKSYFGTNCLIIETYVSDEHVATNTFDLLDLVQDFVEKRASPSSNLVDDEEGVEEAYALIDALKEAADFINDGIDDGDEMREAS